MCLLLKPERSTTSHQVTNIGDQLPADKGRAKSPGAPFELSLALSRNAGRLLTDLDETGGD